MDFQIINRLIRCSKTFSHREIRMHEMNETECMLCTYISANPDCSQDEAASALLADKTTVAKALMRLEDKHLVARIRDTRDKRRNHLRITAEGQEKLHDLIHIHDGWLQQVMTCLNDEEQQQFESYCVRLLECAEKLTENKLNGGNTECMETRR